MKETISLQEILKIIKKRFILIIGFVVIFSGTSAAISYFYLPPIYQAQTQLLVNQKAISEDSFLWNQLEMDFQLIDTYNVIIKSPAILNKVIEEQDLKLTTEQLSQKIKVSNEENSKVVNITVDDQSPKQSVEIANKVALIFKDEIPNLMNVDNINILSVATLDNNPVPIKPNKMLNITVAGVIGLLLSIGIGLVLEMMNTTIRNEKDIEENIELPIMGIIGHITIDLKKETNPLLRKEENLV